MELRVIFSMYTHKENGRRSLVVWDTNHHDAAYDRVQRLVVPEMFRPTTKFLEPEFVWSDKNNNLKQLASEPTDEEDLTNELLLFEIPHQVLNQPERYHAFERSIDRYLKLTEQQEELLKKNDCAYLVQGAAGSGKTALALLYALNLHNQFPEDDVFFFTYQEELACVCRCYLANMVESDQHTSSQGKLRVFSYLQFCQHYLSKRFANNYQESWRSIDRAKSHQYLQAILNRKAKWKRNIKADNLYGYVYSIFKGRFIPGTDRLPSSSDDFKRIFKE